MLLLLPRRRRHNIPIHMVMTTTVLIRWMLVVTMVLLVLGVIVVVEVIEGCRRRRWIFCETGLLLLRVGVVVSSGKVLLGGDRRELGGVVVGVCWGEWGLGSGEVGGFFGDGRGDVGVGAEFSAADSRGAGASQGVRAGYGGGFGEV